MKKKYIVTAVVTFVAVLALLVGARLADADTLVDGMFNWYDPCGYTCYQWADGSGDCYPCYEGETCYVPTSDPTPTPIVPRPLPTSTPAPEATDIPKEVCNQGRGNEDDGCSPGNSDNKHDPNDSQKESRE